MGLTLNMTHIDHFYYTHLCAPLIFMFNLSAFCIQAILNFREIDKHINQNILGHIHIFTLVNLPPYVCFFVRFQVDISILLMSMLTPQPRENECWYSFEAWYNYFADVVQANATLKIVAYNLPVQVALSGTSVMPPGETSLLTWAPADTSVDPVLVYCWTSVCDGGPTINQYWMNASYFLCMLYQALYFLWWEV